MYSVLESAADASKKRRREPALSVLSLAPRKAAGSRAARRPPLAMLALDLRASEKKSAPLSQSSSSQPSSRGRGLWHPQGGAPGPGTRAYEGAHFRVEQSLVKLKLLQQKEESEKGPWETPLRGGQRFQRLQACRAALKSVIVIGDPQWVPSIKSQEWTAPSGGKSRKEGPQRVSEACCVAALPVFLGSLANGPFFGSPREFCSRGPQQGANLGKVWGHPQKESDLKLPRNMQRERERTDNAVGFIRPRPSSWAPLLDRSSAPLGGEEVRQIVMQRMAASSEQGPCRRLSARPSSSSPWPLGSATAHRECKIPLYNLDSENNLDMRSILNPLKHTQLPLYATRQLSSLAWASLDP